MGSVSLWEGKLDHAIRHKNGVSLDVGSATLMVDGCNPGCVGWPSSAVGPVPQKRFLVCPCPAPMLCAGGYKSVARGERVALYIVSWHWISENVGRGGCQDASECLNSERERLAREMLTKWTCRGWHDLCLRH